MTDRTVRWAFWIAVALVALAGGLLAADPVAAACLWPEGIPNITHRDICP